MKIKTEDGKEIEVFTQAEMEEQAEKIRTEAAEKAVEEYRTANPDKSEEINKLKTDLEKAQKDLEDAEKGGDKDGQVARLRKERDEANQKLNEFATTITKRLDDITNASANETKEELLTKFSKGDKELRKKIEFEFDNYRPNDKSKKAIEERLQVAVQLATGSKPAPSFMDNISGGGDRGSQSHYGSNKTEPSQNQIAIGRVLGITDADRKAHEEFKAKQGK